MKNLYAYKIIFFSCALFFSLSVFGKEQPPQYVKDLANQSTDERINYFFILKLRWIDTPLNHARLDSLKNIATELNDKRLQQYMLLFEKRDIITLSKSDTEKENVFLAAEQIAEQSSYKDVKAYSYFVCGMDAFYNKDYTKGLPLIFQSKKLLEEAHYEAFPYSVYYYKGFFDMYYYFEDYKSAADYCLLAIKHPNNELYVSFGFYNNLGLCYLKMKDYDKAKASFQEGIAEAGKSGNTNFKALIVGNLGNVLRKQGQYKEALPYLYEDAMNNEKAIPENAAISRMYIAHALLQLDSVGKAKQYMTPPDFVMPNWTWPGYDLIRFETLALYNQKTGNFKLASQYKDSLIGFKDTLRVLFDAKKLTVLESSLQAEKYINERKILEINAQSERFRRNAIIMVLLLLFGGIVYWLVKRRKQEQVLEQQKQQRAEELLARANQQLMQYLSTIKEKNDIVERISQQLEDANSIAHTLSETERNKYLDNLQNSVILTETHWAEFKTLFEQVFPSFFTHLNKNYPDLTASEIRLLALEKLDLPDKDMGNILGISADSVKKTRYRLRKKHAALLVEH